MLPNTTLKLIDGVRIVVPDSLDLITTFVLREQEDWFEDEIKFLRFLIQPGQTAIDIGANYGVYTLTIANLVGPTGHVWAFEPASSTAALLADSISTNNFSHVTLICSALSNKVGTARLALNNHSELNELVRDEQFAGASETVPLTTLDHAMASYAWKDIDFIKIDAEGEEANILLGGTSFLKDQSPLIQYEIKAGNDLHLDLVRQFSELGYQSYRLVPGLNTLIPFNENDPIDDFLLNLFCCKPDRAGHLASQGFLVDLETHHASSHAKDAYLNLHMSSADDPHGWHEELIKHPYGKLLAKQWVEHSVEMEENGQPNEIDEPLYLYALSRNQSLPMPERFAYLEASFFNLRQLCENQPTYLRLSSLARVASDYGARIIANNALEQLCNNIFKQQSVNTVEPFLAPGKRYELIPPNTLDSIWNWIASAALEELIRTQAFSSYYTGLPSLQNLKILLKLEFASDEMKRRHDLMEQRFGV